jgi:hypothetical protein
MDVKGLKERITGGLIVWALVTIFIQPILSFTWKVTVIVGGVIHKGYLDGIYRSAARGDFNNNFAYVILSLLLLGTLLIVMFFSIREMKNLDQSHILVRISDWIWKVMVVVSFLLILIVFAISDGTSKITASFTQRLTVLAPAVSDTEYKTLKARWASMKGKADYDALVAAMDKRATELGVTLPPVRNP